jgi:iron complex outermembrane receptor protein
MAKGSYYGSFQSALFGYSESTLQTYGSKVVIDAEVGFRFTPKMRVALGGRNLFDSYPDRMSVDNGFQLFLHPPASPFGYNGRFVYARLEFVAGN